MTEPTADELARWGELAEQATPGPWGQATSTSAYLMCPGCEHGNYVARAMDNGHYEHRHELLTDAEFIAAARTAVPRLLALVAAQADQIAELRDGMFGWRKHCYDAWVERDASEAKIARVRAACDEADRRGLGTDHIRAALDGTEATP